MLDFLCVCLYVHLIMQVSSVFLKKNVN